jgi:hypothetical protein
MFGKGKASESDFTVVLSELERREVERILAEAWSALTDPAEKKRLDTIVAKFERAQAEFARSPH